MKKIPIILLLIFLIAGQAFSGGQVLIMKKKTGACTASYGSEIRTSNTADKPSDTDADAVIDTTGWASQGLAQLISTDDADSTCGDGDDDCQTPQRGTYQIFMRADSDGDRGYHVLTGYSLAASTVYKISYYARHSGVASTADWKCFIFDGSASATSTGSYNQTFTTAQNTYANYTTYILYNAYQNTFICGECGATNDGGIYIDNFSITAATLCYGDELYVGTADSLNSESDATTGWAALNSGTVTSVDDADTLCGVAGDADCAAPHNGTYSLFIRSDQSTASSGAYYDLNSILTSGKKYMLRAWVRGDGTNAFVFGMGSTTSNLAYTYIYVLPNTYAEIGYSFTFGSDNRYLSVVEANSGNDGYLYIDGMTIKEITGE